MPNGGSLLTLTYYGAEKVMPHYNVMGVAKAAPEASVRYLAADLGKGAIRVNAIWPGRSRRWLRSADRRLPLHPEVERVQFAARRTVSIEDGGRCALFCCRTWLPGVTGEYPAYRCRLPRGVGMKNEKAPDISVVKE